MATVDYAIRERLPELSKQIDNTHFSYLETDDCPEKLDQRKKLEGYITDFLYLVPHENKFILQATRDVFSRSALSNSDFSGYRLARGWAALARYAANLLSQPWRKEYCTIRLYSGFYKHEVEGSGLCGAIAMLSAMGYKAIGNDKAAVDTLILDGPVCPDLVAAVSRDSLIAYVECQLMTQIWEEVSIRGGKCSWLDVFHCRKNYIGNVEQSISIVLHMQRRTEDLYCNVKFPHISSVSTVKQHATIQKPVHMNTNIPQYNGSVTHAVHNHHPVIQSNSNGSYLPDHPVKYPPKYHHNTMPNNYMIANNDQYCQNSVPQPYQQHNNYDGNHMYLPNNFQMSQCRMTHNYQRNPMPDQPYILQPLPYNHMNHTMLPVNGHHCMPIAQAPYCPPVTTGQLIEIESPTYLDNNVCHNVPISPPHDRSLLSNYSKGDYLQKEHSLNHHILKYKRNNEDNIENQENIRRNSAPRTSTSYVNDRPLLPMPRSDTQPSLSKAREDGKGTYESWNYVYQNLESRGLKENFDERDNSTNPSYAQKKESALEDSFNYLSLERPMDDDVVKKSQKLKNDMRTAKNTVKRSTELYNGTHNSVEESNARTKTTDKTSLIPKEDARIKKEIDRETLSKKTVVRNSEVKRKTSEYSNHSNGIVKKNQEIGNHSLPSNDATDSIGRLVVSLKGSEVSNGTHNQVPKRKTSSSNQWECGACTYINQGAKKVCDICGKSRQIGVEAQPLRSGGKECPLCTLVNEREAVVCEACSTNLKDSPTYI